MAGLPQVGARGFLVILALAALAACGGGSTPTITATGLAGTWTAGRASISFNPDSSFVATNLDLSAQFSGCRDVSGAGSWRFVGTDGVYGGSAYKGDEVALNFNYPVSSACDTYFMTWEPSPPVGLCLYLGSGSQCTGAVFTKHGTSG